MRKINVAVLMGGKSSEREISLVTGRNIVEALDKKKYNAFPIDTAGIGANALNQASVFGYLPGNEAEECIACTISPEQIVPDVAFIALHGRFGEDGTIQGMLELAGIPYVGSGVLASALAIDKIMARKVMQADGIPMAKGISIESRSMTNDLIDRVICELGFPVVVKPNKEGSSFGLSIARSAEEFGPAVELAFKYDDSVLLEEYIDGIEITVPVLGNEELTALPIIEIVPTNSYYDTESKYAPGGSTHIIPAGISENATAFAKELAVKSHKSLGCSGVSRVDMIVRNEEVFVLEVNTIPGMTSTSLLPESARHIGIEFPQLLDKLIGFALDKR